MKREADTIALARRVSLSGWTGYRSASSVSGFVRLACCVLALVASPLLAVEMAPTAITPDGGRYFGALVEGRREGPGRIEWSNGARYEGGFAAGLFSGHGRYQLASGAAYEGEFVDGMMSGRGRLVTAERAVYVGEFAADTFNGNGRYELADGDVYEGNFKSGHLEGEGTYRSATVSYRGQFRLGQFSGRGELTFADGRIYSGEFVAGKMQGRGRYGAGNGDVYEGDFDHDEFTGRGSFTRSDGSTHRGTFVKWRPQGQGTFTDAAGNVYEGEFSEGELNGSGTATRRDGTRYEGQFKAWRFDGQGVLRFANGDMYSGGFANGLYEGPGVLTYAKPRGDGRIRDSGIWHQGRLNDADAAARARVGVEAALYRQRPLLDAALAQIAPRDPTRINLYLLAIAGDGTQEVFRREVDFVRNQFDTEYGTKGRSLALVNSRNTLDSAPMATLTSVQESLDVIASRMDKEKDILFVFLTSHGSADHELSLDIGGMDLRNLKAKELGAMLAATGIKWKVVVVSACYAGGFIDFLKDDSTLVIAAARRDRRSFGCADENDFTYFGRAYFKESLPQSESFEQAFQKAETLVQEWEARDQAASGSKAPESSSFPQMADTPAIAAYLRRWRAGLSKR